MGIDPGTNFMGYAIIKVFGKNQKPEYFYIKMVVAARIVNNF